MDRLVFTFPDSPRTMLRLDDVRTQWDGPDRRQRTALDPAQAVRLVGAWMRVQPGRTIHTAPWRANRWTWVLTDEHGEQHAWYPVGYLADTDAPRWFVHTFPTPVRTRTPVSDSVALGTIHAFVNQPGGVSGGDLVDVVCEVLERAGMPVND
jgi:hypothetical protein